MIMNRNRQAIWGCGRKLFCLLFAVLIAAGWSGIAFGESNSRVLNDSGNRNIPLAVDPIEDGEGYSAILYDNRNGLPTSAANAIVQTSEGFIWIGCYAGLIRYDGNTFERIATDEGILNTRCLYVDRRDRLWIGTNDFGIFLMTKTELRRVDQPDQLVSLSIRSMAEDAKGVIYVGTAAGIATIDNALKLTVLEDARISGEVILDLRLGENGLIYGVTWNGDLFTLKDGKIASFLPHDACPVGKIQAILPDPVQPGMIFLAAKEPEGQGTYVFHGTLVDNLSSTEAWDVSPLDDVQSMEFINGQVWLCAGNGIGKLNGAVFHQLKNVPMDKMVGHMMTDYEGNLWFTSTRQCVMKIAPNRFLDLFERCGLAPEVVNSTCMYGERLFIGTDSGLTVIKKGKVLHSVPLTRAETASGEKLRANDLLSFLKGVRIRSINRDSKGRLWISTWSKYGLLRFDQGRLKVFTKEDGLISEQARTVSECEDGSILVAQPDGISVIQDDRVAACYGTKDGLVVPAILTAAEGFNHELILGSDGGGIYIIGPEGTKHIGLKEGLKSEVILRVKHSRYRDIYWIATGNSLAYMTPDYKVTTIDGFSYSDNYDFYENSRGDVWVISSNGIYVVSAEELLANQQISEVFLGVSSGLPYIATSNSFSELTDDGDLYIAGVNGAIRVNIEKPFESVSELKVALPFIDIDGKRVYPDKSGSFAVPHNARKLTIYPFVFNNSLIDPWVSYQLSGFDPTETTMLRSELAPVDYTNLHKGVYSFDIRVNNPIGDENISASFRIVKEKALSEGTAGSIIMDATALFFMGGILIYTSLYRKRGRLDDKLFFAMVLANITLAAAEVFSYLLEIGSNSFLRELMYAVRTIFYVALEIFPYLFLLFLDYRAYEDRERFKRTAPLHGIPCALFFLLLAINLKTGWIFSVTKGNAYQTGPLVHIAFVPLFYYFLVALPRARRINSHLVLLGILLIAARIIWDIWYTDISSIAFVYTLFLVCTHIHVINRPMMYEEAP